MKRWGYNVLPIINQRRKFMTGLGFFIFWCGLAAATVFEHLAYQLAEKIAIVFIFLGGMLMLAGVSMWLLQVMP